MIISGSAVLVLAALGFMFLVSYWFFKLGELSGLQHFFLQLLMVGFLLFGSSVLGVAVLDAGLDCQYLLVEKYCDNCGGGDTNSTYTYDRVCLNEPTQSAFTFNTVLSWFWRLVTIYMFLWLLFELLSYLGKLPKNMRRGGDD